MIQFSSVLTYKLSFLSSSPLSFYHLRINTAAHVEKVGHLFERDRFASKKELEEMKKLAADAFQHFPPEFDQAMANPGAIKASFKNAPAAAASL